MAGGKAVHGAVVLVKVVGGMARRIDLVGNNVECGVFHQVPIIALTHKLIGTFSYDNAGLLEALRFLAAKKTGSPLGLWYDQGLHDLLHLVQGVFDFRKDGEDQRRAVMRGARVVGQPEL